jgi:hypothetical protein
LIGGKFEPCAGLDRDQFMDSFGANGVPQLEASRILRVLVAVRWPRG